MMSGDVITRHRAELAATPEPEPVRLAYAAAHLVMKDSYAASSHTLERPGAPEEIEEAIDWPGTMAIRRHLAAQGFAVAEAMDTAQRFQIGWRVARRLVEECGRLRLPRGFVAGAGADGVPDGAPESEVIDAVVAQARAIQSAGGEAILLPLPWLPRNRAGEDGCVRLYEAVVRELPGPLLLHWLGPMFAPELAGYFPGRSLERILAFDPAKVRGLKLSMLDAGLELRLRRELLLRDQILLTGDDWNFARLIRGGDPAADVPAPPVERWTAIGGRSVALGDFSHALLGILDAIAVPAGLALRWLARGRTDRYLELMLPCEEISRVIFEPPTRHYKAGLAFLAHRAGLQSNSFLVNHEERARDPAHYMRLRDLSAGGR